MQVSDLQTLSSFSLPKSPILIDDLVKDVVDKGYSSLALTDINVTYGLVDFYLVAKKVSLKPLFGMIIRPNGIVDQAHRYNLISIAKNNQGYKNILRLSSAISLKTDNGDEHKVLTLKQLAKYLSDQASIVPINITGGLRYLIENNEKLGSDFIRELQKIIPSSSDLYLGAYAGKNQPYIDYTKSMAKQFNLPLAVTENAQYLQASDHFLVKTLKAIKQGQELVDTSSLALQKGSHYLRTSGESVSAYNERSILSALHSVAKIADECKASVTLTQPELSKYKQSFASDSKIYLRQLVQKELAKRSNGQSTSEICQKRLDYELKIIDRMGFDDYFLVVWDVINHAYSVDITTGLGHGSVAGLLVAHSLAVTEVDPIKYNSPFERFLSPARAQMPDIDLDISDNRRDEVIKYMFEEYGMDHAAQILTFGTLVVKQVLCDRVRVFGSTTIQANKSTHVIPLSKSKITLAQAY